MWARRMCGYSITSYPRLKDMPPDVTTALTRYSPAVAVAAGRTSNFTVCVSSSRVNLTTSCAGRDVQPWGSSRRTVLSPGAFASFTTVTRTSRPAAGRGAALAPVGLAARMDDEGMIAISGDTRTDAAGTTSRSERFSPLKMFPSYRYCTSVESTTSTASAPLPIVSVTCARNGVGRYGRPNGASASNVYRPASPARCQYGSVERAVD